MSDDIVTRLRFALENFRNDPQPVLLEDAADEIERLQRECDHWIAIASKLAFWGSFSGEGLRAFYLWQENDRQRIKEKHHG